MSDPIKVVGFSYIRGGKTYLAWPASEETLERLHAEGKIKALNGECTCGSADFCDTFTNRLVRCFSVTSDRCELFETNDVC